MGYYIRVLAQNDVEIPIHQLQRILEEEETLAVVKIQKENASRWSELSLLHSDGTEIAIVERNSVSDGELGAEEIDEFIEELETAWPQSSAQWLKEHLREVKVIYAFQILDGADVNNGWGAVRALFRKLRIWCDGISQADGEGFSNHDGSQITWQFGKNVKGDWQMAVLDHGTWKTFRMKLENPEHRAAFLRGVVPRGVQLL